MNDKGQGCDDSTTMKRPKPLDLSHHFSDVTNNRKPSRVKSMYKYFAIPGMQNLAGG